MQSQALPVLSCVMPVYLTAANKDMLNGLLYRYSGYSSSIMKHIQFVLVDDCSDKPVAIPKTVHLNISLFRIGDSIKWNQPGARNLGVTMAPSAKILLTDIDHYFPQELLEMMLKAPVPANELFVFERKNSEGEKVKSHCNTFFTSKSVFFKSLGYDESFCGNYGYDDSMFILMQERLGTRLAYFCSDHCITGKSAGVAYSGLVRDTAANKLLFEEKKMLLVKSADPYICHSRLFLNFKWKKVWKKPGSRPDSGGQPSAQ